MWGREKFLPQKGAVSVFDRCSSGLLKNGIDYPIKENCMKTSILIKSSIQSKLLHLFGIWMVVLLLVGAVFTAQPAGVAKGAPLATCTSTSDGDWTAGIWDCGGGPVSGDDVIIDSFVTLNTTTSVGTLTITANGALTFAASQILTINGNLTIDAAGILDTFSNSGSVIFGPGSQTITTNGNLIEFYNLTKTASAPGNTLTIDSGAAGTGGIKIFNDLTLTGTAPSTYLLLRKAGSGSQWQIRPVGDGIITVDYVDVKDSIVDTTDLGHSLDVDHGIDSGNNTNWGLTGVTVVLTTPANPVFQSSPVTLTATISSPTATGSIDFEDNDVIILCTNTPTITNGVATCETSFSVEGTHPLKAEYSGGGSYSSTVSNTLSQVVQHVVAVGLNSPSGTVSLEGAEVTFTSIITPMIGTGTVKFMADGVAIPGCTAVFVPPASGGMAVCKTSSLAAKRGTYEITSEFTEAVTNNKATSSSVTHKVMFLGAVGITSPGSPSAFLAPVTFTATVTPLGAEGSVTFIVDGVNVPTCVDKAINGSGVAQCTVTMPGGTHNVSVSYSGDEFTQSNGGQMTQVVNLGKYFFPVIGK
jgi:large repetitive protein